MKEKTANVKPQVICIENTLIGLQEKAESIALRFNCFLKKFSDEDSSEIFGIFIGYGYMLICSPEIGLLTHQIRYNDTPVWGYEVLDELSINGNASSEDTPEERSDFSNNNLLWWTAVPNGLTDSFVDVFQKPLKKAIRKIERTYKQDSSKKIVVIAMPPLSKEFHPDYETLCAGLPLSNARFYFVNHLQALNKEHETDMEIRFMLACEDERNTVIETSGLNIAGEPHCNAEVVFQTLEEQKEEGLSQELVVLPDAVSISSQFESHDVGSIGKVSEIDTHTDVIRAVPKMNLAAGLTAFLSTIDPNFYQKTYKKIGEPVEDEVDIKIGNAMHAKAATVATICAELFQVADLSQIALNDMAIVHRHMEEQQQLYVGTDLRAKNDLHRSNKYGNLSDFQVKHMDEVPYLPANFATVCWQYKGDKTIVPYFKITKEKAHTLQFEDLLISIVDHYDHCSTVDAADDLLYFRGIRQSASAMFVAKVFLFLEQHEFVAEKIAEPIEADIDEPENESNIMSIQSLKIEKLGLSSNTYNKLRGAGSINTVADLWKIQESDPKLVNIGSLAMREVYDKLKELGMDMFAKSYWLDATTYRIRQQPKSRTSSTLPVKNLEAIYNITIEEMGLSVRAYNCLKRTHRIQTVRDIVKLSVDDMKKIRNLGRKSTLEILMKLKSYGLKVEDKIVQISQTHDNIK